MTAVCERPPSDSASPTLPLCYPMVEMVSGSAHATIISRCWCMMFFTDESLHATKRAEVQALLAGLDSRYRVARAVTVAGPGTGGPYFLGPAPSIADISIVTLLARFDVLLRVGATLPDLHAS